MMGASLPGAARALSGRRPRRFYFSVLKILTMRHTSLPWICLALLIAVAIGCSEARLQGVDPEEEEEVDHLLSIQGQYCTERSGNITFPVRVLFVLDQSNSLQCLDSENRRFEALQDAINQIRSIPNAEFAFLGFASWVRETEFTRDPDVVQEFLDPAQGLGPATDYQGVLASTVRKLENDMRATDPRERARTRYIVNFVSDGVPEPVCTAGCDSSQPPDSLYGVCNTNLEIPDDEYVEHTPCQPYNQPEQILARVNEIMELGELYEVGRINLNSILLFSPVHIVQQLCGDVAEQFGYDRIAATAILREMANAGEGVFQDVNLAQGDSDYLRINVSSMPAQYGLSTLIADNINAVYTEQGLQPDSDGDGLSDSLERELGTDPYHRDTDRDGYSDYFEWYFRNEGFDPRNEDKPALSCRDSADRNGSGLSVCEEDFIDASSTSPDSAGDGIPDGLALRMGLNPRADARLGDVGFDGISDFDSVRAGIHPRHNTPDRQRAERILYDLNDLGLGQVRRVNNDNTDERRCYDYELQRIPLAPASLPRERGRNRIKIYAQDRRTEMGGAGGVYKIACFEALYDGQTKFPEEGVIDVSQKTLEANAEEYYQRLLRLSQCGYFDVEEETDLVGRDEIQEMMATCMPPRIRIENRLYHPDEIHDLMDRHIDSSARLRLPEMSYGFFVPAANFRPNRDCHRPWERRIFEILLDDLIDVCETCAPAAENGD